MQELGIGNVVAIATALLGGAGAAIIRLYRDRNAERARADELARQLHHEHKRDLRHVAGLPTSMQPPFVSTQHLPKLEIRGEQHRDDETPPETERPPPRKPPRPR